MIANIVRIVSLLASLAEGVARAEVHLITEGRAVAVVVTADQPTAVAKYAAEELVRHVEKAAGVKLRVIAESEVGKSNGALFYVGDCSAVRQAGIEVGKLQAEAFVLRAEKGKVFVAGDDGGGDPLDPDTRAGTLWGVYEWLERSLQVRWIWPGELGTFVPKRKDISSAEMDEITPMRFLQRRLRPGLGFAPEHRALGFTEKAAEKFAAEQTVFLRRHRMGRSYPFGYGHAFVDWWEKEGKAHPEWFQLRENGERGPAKRNGRFSMCVSNEELQKEVVARWMAKGGGKRAPSFINACENDILGLCACESCRALDAPPPADHLAFYPPGSKMEGARFVSDRYAHFWLGVQQRAAAVNPEVTVIGYAYFNYFAAPTGGIRLNPHILVGFCPSAGWFPRSDAEHAWMKRQWTGWRDTGARLFMRSNHLLDGYCMPFIFAHQFADEFHHAAEQGMVATDYDSLTGHWATQGPNLYTALRLHARPEASADELLAEYYGGFEQAGPVVKRYFDYWEEHTQRQTDSISRVLSQLETSRWRSFARAAHAVFPPESFAPAEALLDEAGVAVRGDAEAAARVAFLRQGLDHAQLCSRVAAKLSLSAPEMPKDESAALLAELMRFRRATESAGIGNFNHAAWLEDLSWRLSEESRQAPDLYP
ncbi:MAG TPA: DUF4838 domain-containing protein [Prosthecobacter sp.]|nr:DUF4838 domain-containing protein [Prosthecobacter sp.]